MIPDLDRLQDLKQKLSQEKELATIWLYFMDHFADHKAFTDLGDRAYHALVESVIKQLCKQLFGKQGKMGNLLLTQIPEHQFLHGVFDVQGRMGGVIYFEETLMGLVAITGIPPSSEVRYARFTGQQFKSQGFSRN